MSNQDAERYLLALANVERIRLLSLIAVQELTATEIGAALGLEADAVAAHLTVLGQTRLIATVKDGHVRRVKLRAESLAEIESCCAERLNSSSGNETSSEEIPNDIRQFFRNGKLVGLPARRSRYLEVLTVLIGDFSPDTDYPEAEVNVILGRRHEDFATLRRDLVDGGFMTRANNIYRRVR